MQPNRVDLTKILKVGDKVWSVMRGNGFVHSIVEKSTYPLNVTFGNNTQQYNIFGFWDNSCIMHELYPSSALEPWQEPLDFEFGDLVWGSDDNKYWHYGWVESMAGKCFNIRIHTGFIITVAHIRPFSDCPLPLKIDVK